MRGRVAHRGRIDPRGAPLLALVAALWGTTFVVVKDTVATIDPGVIVLGRFVIAAVVLIPFVRRGRALAAAGIELGAWLWIGYLSQAAGLAYIGASRSAFITAVNVVLVPVLAVLVGRRIGRAAWLAALLALLGVGLLANDGAPPNLGDLLTLVTAVSYAGYILRLEAHAGRFSPHALATAQVLGVLPFALADVALRSPGGIGALGQVAPAGWAALLYLGLVTTALSTWLQTIGQGRVGAPQAAVIYSTEPVWATLWAALLLGERFGVRGGSGAALVVLAIVLGQVPLRRWRKAYPDPAGDAR